MALTLLVPHPLKDTECVLVTEGEPDEVEVALTVALGQSVEETEVVRLKEEAALGVWASEGEIAKGV